MNIEQYYIPGILLGAFMVSFFLFPSFIKLLERKNLVDSPDHRKIHERTVPGMGGVIIIISTMITIPFFFGLEELVYFRVFIGALLIMFVVGLRDDIVPLKPIHKLISQLVPILIVIFFFDIRIESLYTMGDIMFPTWFQVLLTAFTMVIITNSLNLIDGVDGLSGSLSMLSLCAFATIFYLTGQTYFAFLLIALSGAILGFLVFNWSPARIFMGDNGALFIGFILSCSAILFLRENGQPHKLHFNGAVGTALAFIAVPLYDMFRIIILRLLSGKKLMSPDKNHIHHLLLDLGLNHARVTLILFTLQAIIIVIALLGKSWPDWIIFTLLAVILFGFNGIILLMGRRKSKTQEAGI